MGTQEQGFEQSSLQFKAKMEEINTNYNERMEECDKLQSELDKVLEIYLFILHQIINNFKVKGQGQNLT